MKKENTLRDKLEYWLLQKYENLKVAKRDETVDERLRHIMKRIEMVKALIRELEEQ